MRNTRGKSKRVRTYRKRGGNPGRGDRDKSPGKRRKSKSRSRSRSRSRSTSASSSTSSSDDSDKKLKKRLALAERDRKAGKSYAERRPKKITNKELYESLLSMLQECFKVLIVDPAGRSLDSIFQYVHKGIKATSEKDKMLSIAAHFVGFIYYQSKLVDISDFGDFYASFVREFMKDVTTKKKIKVSITRNMTEGPTDKEGPLHLIDLCIRTFKHRLINVSSDKIDKFMETSADIKFYRAYVKYIGEDAHDTVSVDESKDELVLGSGSGAIKINLRKLREIKESVDQGAEILVDIAGAFSENVRSKISGAQNMLLSNLSSFLDVCDSYTGGLKRKMDPMGLGTFVLNWIVGHILNPTFDVTNVHWNDPITDFTERRYRHNWQIVVSVMKIIMLHFNNGSDKTVTIDELYKIIKKIYKQVTSSGLSDLDENIRVEYTVSGIMIEWLLRWRYNSTPVSVLYLDDIPISTDLDSDDVPSDDTQSFDDDEDSDGEMSGED